MSFVFLAPFKMPENFGNKIIKQITKRWLLENKRTMVSSLQNKAIQMNFSMTKAVISCAVTVFTGGCRKYIENKATWTSIVPTISDLQLGFIWATLKSREDLTKLQDPFSKSRYFQSMRNVETPSHMAKVRPKVSLHLQNIGMLLRLTFDQCK